MKAGLEQELVAFGQGIKDVKIAFVKQALSLHDRGGLVCVCVCH